MGLGYNNPINIFIKGCHQVAFFFKDGRRFTPASFWEAQTNFPRRDGRRFTPASFWEAQTNFQRRDGRRFTPASFWEAQTNSKPAASPLFFLCPATSLKQAWLVSEHKKTT
jgi:hypothetical protein